MNCTAASPHTTNNRMELIAVIKGLSALREPCQVAVVTDSEYVRRGVTQWMSKWKQNHWVTSGKTPVKNKDMWEAPGPKLGAPPDALAMGEGSCAASRQPACGQAGPRGRAPANLQHRLRRQIVKERAAANRNMDRLPPDEPACKANGLHAGAGPTRAHVRIPKIAPVAQADRASAF